ncbi:hypothetical protein OPQ81_003036 [Rhizoctonia solani]|nr:hypothetical protein OPQ81_003036 [Rhizoctonia solani]
MLQGTTVVDKHDGIFGAMDTPEFRLSVAQFMEIEAVMDKGDRLPNTAATLEAKIERRALLVAVRYGCDGRYARDQYSHMLISPGDILRVCYMLLTRGYQAQNIRILADGVSRDPLSRPTKQNIRRVWRLPLSPLGHGCAYEVEEREGKAGRIRTALPTLVEYKVPFLSTKNEESSSSTCESQTKFYREAFITEWKTPTWPEMLEMQMRGSLELDAYNRINDQEFNVMIAKLPKGCLLTMSLDCFHGGRIQDVNRLPTGPVCRGEVGQPEGNQYVENLLDTYSNTRPRNLFVPPAFYLHSESCFDPKVRMERVQGPGPLHNVKATIFVWSGYSTSHAQTGVFTSAFTDAAQDLKGDMSHHEVLQDIRRRIGEATEGKDSDLVIQLLIPWDENNKEADASISGTFVI